MNKALINLLVFMYFLFTYYVVLIWFYLTHYILFHNTGIVGSEYGINFTEWCPFGSHDRSGNGNFGLLLMFFPFVFSIINLVIFINVKKIIKWTLVFIPIIVFIILYLLIILFPIN